MSELEPAVFTKLKKMKKLIKLEDGFQSAPVEVQTRIQARIQTLTRDLGIEDHNDLLKQYETLKSEISAKTSRASGPGRAATLQRILNPLSAWYLRPLISHFDSPKKVRALKSDNEGIGGLQHAINLFLPPEIYSVNQAEIYENLKYYFQFKSLGKGKSQQLETEFYTLFKVTDRNPFPFTTLGSAGLPAFYYGKSAFETNQSTGKESVIVSGLCPISGIVDELAVRSQANEIWRHILGFEPLALPPGDFEVVELIWPKRPILSDYISLKNMIETLKYYNNQADTAELSGLLWYPSEEYIRDLTEVTFSNYIEAGELTRAQIVNGFNEVRERYIKLLRYVVREEEYEGKLEMRSTRARDLDGFESIVDRLNLDPINNIYGVWKGNPVRKRLYLYLIVKHILPAMNGLNTLHLENSYEIWPNIQASRINETGNEIVNNSSSYAWICYPSTPSPSLSYMRDYNAPHDDKLYLAVPSAEFEDALGKLTKNYIIYIAPQLFNFEQLKSFKFQDLKCELHQNLIKLNRNVCKY